MRFEPDRPIETTRPTVVVDAGLAPGEHVFQLVVINARGQRSQPVAVTVIVGGRQPVPVTPITDPLRPLPTPRRPIG